MSFTPSQTRPMIGPIENQQLQRILANWKLTPATYAQKISRNQWIPSPHLQHIALRIAKSVAKGNARIILSMPPRHGKSELVSVYTPAWLLEYLGKVNIILASYGAELAEGFHNRVRNIIDDPINEELLRVRPGNPWKAGELVTSVLGYFYAVGLGGSITGRGADVLLIDDYIKEVKEALSPAYRDYIWNWYVTTAYTRLEPNGSIIIIATRWHSDDLIGRLRSQEPERWEYIELPAIARKGDILGREPGTPLFPERYTIEALNEIKRTLGTIWFEALYQQQPVDETMRVTDTSWLKMWSKDLDLPYRKRKCRIWDLAATEAGGDWLTGGLFSYDEKNQDFFIEDFVHEQVGPGKVEEIVAITARDDGYAVEIGIEQEPGAAGKILVEHYTNNVLKDYKVSAVNTGGKAKLIRAQPFLAAAEDGHVFYLQAPAWNKIFIAEFETFPSTNRAIHDDMIDTAGEGYTMLTGKKNLSAVWGRVADEVAKQHGITPQDLTAVNTRGRSWNRSKYKKDQQAAAKSSNVRIVKGATWGPRRRIF